MRVASVAWQYLGERTKRPKVEPRFRERGLQFTGLIRGPEKESRSREGVKSGARPRYRPNPEDRSRKAVYRKIIVLALPHLIQILVPLL